MKKSEAAEGAWNLLKVAWIFMTKLPCEQRLVSNATYSQFSFGIFNYTRKYPVLPQDYIRRCPIRSGCTANICSGSTVSQTPLQFHCIFYRQTMQILNVKTAKKYLQWVVCKNCSESAVEFVTQWKPVVFAVKILAVHLNKPECPT